MRRAAVVFLAALVLWTAVAAANHALAPLHVWLFAGGLFVAYSALALPRGPGLAAAALAGCVCDAGAPVPFGTQALLFSLAHLLIFNGRDRLPREETAGRVLVALAANLGLFLALSFALARRLPAPAAQAPRMIADLAWSQLFVALVGPWFFALQERGLELAGAGRFHGHR